MIFQLQNGGKLKITQEALKMMISFVQNEDRKLEAGGVLLGRFIKDTKNIVIDEISVPQKNDKRERCFFFKNHQEHQKIMIDKWKASKGTCTYIGEWHTHPEKYPIPSLIDKQTWQKLVQKAVFHNNSLFFIIVGIVQLVAFEVNKKNFNITRLKQL